jgi:putative Holliday junction resolvase
MAAVLALDIGEKRIGVATANLDTRLASPLVTLSNDDRLVSNLKALCDDREVTQLVAGLPRGLDGQETAQTQYARMFGDQLAAQLQLPVYYQDEAVTSQQAKAELEARGKPYAKGEIDALAATYILEDYLANVPTVTES